MGTMWCLYDLTPFSWCKTDAHSTDLTSNWLERLPAGSISTWEDLTTHFLAQFFPPGRTSKLRHDILMFQNQVQNFYDHVNPATRRTIDQSAGCKLRDKNTEESWALLEDLAFYDNESWNDTRDFAKPVKAIFWPQDVLSTCDRRLIELENHVQHLMEAHLAHNSSVQVNKIFSSCVICNGPHDTQYCMENPEQAFVDYASSRTNEARGKWFTFKHEQNNLGDTYNPSWKSYSNLRLSKFEADFKQQQSKMTNKIDTFLKFLPNGRPLKFIPLQMVFEIGTPKPKGHEHALENECKDLHLNLTVLEVLDHAPIYNAFLDKYVESLELGKNVSVFMFM
ncbi:MAK10-like protein [Tanacetum coccineum]